MNRTIKRGTTGNGCILRIPAIYNGHSLGSAGANPQGQGQIVVVPNEATTGISFDAGNGDIEDITVIGTYEAPTSGKCRARFMPASGAVADTHILEIHLAESLFASGSGFSLAYVDPSGGPDVSISEISLANQDALNEPLDVNVASWFSNVPISYGTISPVGGAGHTIEAMNVDPDQDPLTASAHQVTAVNVPDSPPGTATILTFDDVSGWSVGDRLVHNAGGQEILVITAIGGLNVTVLRAQFGSPVGEINETDPAFLTGPWPATVLTFDDVTGFVEGQVLKPGGSAEHLLIEMISGLDVTVTRRWNSTDWQALTVGTGCSTAFFGSGATSDHRFTLADLTGLFPGDHLLFGSEVMRLETLIDGDIIVARNINGVTETLDTLKIMYRVPVPRTVDQPLYLITESFPINQPGGFSPDPQNATSITFINTGTWAVGDVLQSPRRSGTSQPELMKITAVSNPTITVQRGYLGTTKISLIDGMIWTAHRTAARGVGVHAADVEAISGSKDAADRMELVFTDGAGSYLNVSAIDANVVTWAGSVDPVTGVGAVYGASGVIAGSISQAAFANGSILTVPPVDNAGMGIQIQWIFQQMFFQRVTTPNHSDVCSDDGTVIGRAPISIDNTDPDFPIATRQKYQAPA